LDELGVTAGPLQVWEGEVARPTQLVDDNGDEHPERLVFLADLDAARTHSYLVNTQDAGLTVAQRTHAEISIKQGGEWQESKYVGGTFHSVKQVTTPPQCTVASEYIRYEGPGIESDLVGYRVYLDWRNGFDIFGKKTSAMALPGVGLDGTQSYHEMSDWGADILKVGESLGMGGYGYWNGSKTVLVSEVAERSATITADGPLYSALEIDYKGWNTGTTTVDLKASLSMQPGSPMVDVTLETSAPLDNLAIGLVAHDAAVMMGDLDITGQAWSYLATFGKQSLFDDNLGMVVLFRRYNLVSHQRDESSHVLVMRPYRNRLSYAFGALWSGQPGGVQTHEEFEAFLAAEVERRTLAPRIRMKTQASQSVTDLNPTQISIRLAESEITRLGDSLAFGGREKIWAGGGRWLYTTGLLMQAMDDLSEAVGDPRFAEFARRTMDSFITHDGAIHTYDAGTFDIDQINSGKMVQRLYAKHGDDKYRKAIDTLAAQLVDHPRTSEGAFWHKQRYTNQLWLDGVYMGMPFLAGLGVMENDDHKIEEAVREFEIVRSHLRDPKTGLYYHAWDEAKQQSWADPETGLSHYFWGRGNGWYAMALVDILDVIPPEKTELRAPLLAIIPELAESLVQVQDASGTWFQIMDMPNKPGNYREATASAMFTYFLAKAINKGYLPESYKPVVEKAWAGLVSEFVSLHADGSFHLTNNCSVAGLGYGRDGSYRYYMSERIVDNDPKGIGPTIMAGLQVSELES